MILMLFLVSMSTFAFNIHSIKALDPTTIAVEPAVLVGLLPGDTFQVNLTVDVGTNQLFMWVLGVSWNPVVLELAGEPIEGSFVKSQTGSTHFVWTRIDQEEGYLEALQCGSLTGLTATGSGVIATFIFRAKAPGNSAIHLRGPPEAQTDPLKPIWINYYGNEYNFDTVTDGAVTVAQPPFSVSISPLLASIGVEDSLTFSSTVIQGIPPYNYRWYLNGNPVPSAISSSWTFTPPVSGIYFVYLKVTDADDKTAQSQTARVTAGRILFSDDFDGGLVQWNNFGDPPPSTFQDPSFQDEWGYSTEGDYWQRSGSWSKSLLGISKSIIIEFRVKQGEGELLDYMFIGIGALQSDYNWESMPSYFGIEIWGHRPYDNPGLTDDIWYIAGFPSPVVHVEDAANDHQFHTFKIKYDGSTNLVEFYKDNKNVTTLDAGLRPHDLLPILVFGGDYFNTNYLDWIRAYSPTSPQPQPAVGGKEIPVGKVAFKPGLQAPWVWLTLIIPFLGTAVFIKLRRRKLS